MSAYKLWYLYCDGENCPRGDGTSQVPFVVDPLPEETAGSQRAEAKLCGWVRRNGKDLCELCKQAPTLPAGSLLRHGDNYA